MSHIFILAYLSVLSGGKSCSLIFYVFFSALPDETAKLIVCVAYKAIRLTDIPRSQLVSSVKAMGIKQAPKEKNSLVKVVAEELVKRNYVYLTS